MSDRSDPPQADEIEISLFGPGYGEALVIHLGFQHWLLVDSCLEPRSGLPATLDYRAALGVDVATAVKLMVATHWHDDHIRGLAATLRACNSARFAVSAALTKDEFLGLIGLHGHDEVGVRHSGLSELTPWSQGARQLPTSADVARLMSLTDRGYITAQPGRQHRQRWSNPVVRDMVRDVTKTMHDVHSGWGQLRLRCPLTGVGQSWTVNAFGDARPLKDLLPSP